jgi:hypothetical protein
MMPALPIDNIGGSWLRRRALQKTTPTFRAAYALAPELSTYV